MRGYINTVFTDMKIKNKYMTSQRSVRKETSLVGVNANIKRLLNAKYGMNQAIEPTPD